MAFAITLLPFVSVRFVPLLDYPNHLARMYVLAHLGDVPQFASAYEAAWSVIPNLGMEGIFALLLPLMDIDTASTVFWIVVVLMHHAGAHVLGRELHGRTPWLAPVAGYFFFSFALFYGFTNYLVGIGVFYFAFAAWLRFWRVGSPGALALTLLLSMLCYFAHLGGYGVLLVSVVAWTTLHRAPLRRRTLALAIVTPPLLLHALFATPLAADGIDWDGPLSKLGMAARFLRTYDLPLDVIFLAAFAGAILLAARAGRGRPSRGALLTGATLLLCFLLAPTRWNGTWALDQRFLLPAAVLLLLALDLDVRRVAVRWLLGVACVVFAARTLNVARAWWESDDRVAAYVGLLDRIPLGGRAHVASFVTLGATSSNDERALLQAYHYATLTRHALVGRLFTYEGQQPLRVRPSFPANASHLEGLAPERVDWSGIFEGSDALLLVHPPRAYEVFLDPLCHDAERRDDVVIYLGCRVAGTAKPPTGP